MQIKIISALALMIISGAAGANPVISHRGVHQNFDENGVSNDTCTASKISESSHSFIENTIPSMKAAFAAGADWVELDIHRTKDNHFVVFHDWTLDCRTDGTGVTREGKLSYIRSLDAGHGYTPDGGKTYPLRGVGKGLIPTLPEVLASFPDGKFLIHLKSRDLEEAKLLAETLGQLPKARQGQLMVYGGTQAMLDHISNTTSVQAWPSKETILGCYKVIMKSGGKDLGECKGRVFGGPLAHAEKIPGWPTDFVSLVHSNGGEFFVMEIDGLAELKKLGGNYQGGIWTDRIELVGPMVD